MSAGAAELRCHHAPAHDAEEEHKVLQRHAVRNEPERHEHPGKDEQQQPGAETGVSMFACVRAACASHSQFFRAHQSVNKKQTAMTAGVLAGTRQCRRSSGSPKLITLLARMSKAHAIMAAPMNELPR